VSDDGRNNVRSAVEGLLQKGFFREERSPDLRVGKPLAVLNADGSQHSWFVPLQVGTKLAGFAQLLPSLTPLRFSGFQHSPDNYDNCPDVADWTDPDRVLARAKAIARPDEELSQPVLSYDQHPDRLAWRVTATSSSGVSRSLFVAGTAAFEGRSARDVT
jgi:hypothetical protein